MLVIIEGADKTGKSTLAKKLSDKLKWPVEHFGAPGPDPATEYASFLLKDRNVICDRFYVGELIYGPLLRNRQRMGPLDVVTIERLCRLNGCVLVHVSPPYELVQDRYRRLGDQLITGPQNKKAYEMFNNICPSRNFQHIIQLLTTDVSSVAVDAIVSRVTDISLSALGVRDHATGIGTVTGSKIVFVGETVNKTTTWLGLPFDRGGSAEYLLKAMVLAGIDEKKVYMCNADKLTRTEVEALTFDGEARFIALGNVAHEKLKKYGVGHVKVPHPQYWRRFHFNDIKVYSDFIKKAAEESYIYNVQHSFR